MRKLLTNIQRLLQRNHSADKDTLELLHRFSDSLFALTTANGDIQSASSALTGRLSDVDAGSFRRFIQCLHESSHFEYQKAINYIGREDKPIVNLEVRTVFYSDSDSATLKIIPLKSSRNSQLFLLHMLSKKQMSPLTTDELSHVEKLTNVGQIAAGIAHELNTPLGSIILSAGSIVDASENAEIVEEATRIKKRAEHCSTVVKELLGYVRRGDKGRERHDLVAIVAKVTDLMVSEFKKRNIKFSFTHEMDDLAIHCNENQIEQVLFNLINNAIYATEENGHIDIILKLDDLLQRTRLTVKDNGRGVRPENLERIFDPFFTTKPGSQGTGLGLALCKKIIAEHGGDISVTSNIRKGTTFDIWLPLKNE